MALYQEACAYHAQFPAGKIHVTSSKSLSSPQDLVLAYSPGVAAPCQAIARDRQRVYDYTAKGNLVAVISNGTAVLGLGQVGPEAAKPVMEGKVALFRKLAGVNAFDLEVNVEDNQTFVDLVKALEPTFGGVNLEDIKAPDCFHIEDMLRDVLHIPVMHDDQHATAVVVAAALINALHLAEKRVQDVEIVVNGAGAGALACVKLLHTLGVPKQHIVVLDSKGVLHSNRADLSHIKAAFTTEKVLDGLQQALQDADVFIGLSVANALNPDYLRLMASNPIVFALANPVPEIAYEVARHVRADVIVATGRVDYPNQVNNVLAFPYIFRGALDVRASTINGAMKQAAVYELAKLARTGVPEQVQAAYPHEQLVFGKDYLIPKAIDPRLLTTVAPAVAQAAIDSGVAYKAIHDWDDYRRLLKCHIKDCHMLFGKTN